MQGKQVEVIKEVYSAYHGIERHCLSLDEKDERNGKTLYSNPDTAETLGEEMIPDLDAVSVEDAAIALILHDQLQRALSLLTPSERKLIHKICPIATCNAGIPAPAVFENARLASVIHIG